MAMWVSQQFDVGCSCNPTISLSEQFLFIQKHIMTEEHIRILVSTRKEVTVICDLLDIRHYKGVVNKIKSRHHQSFQGGNIMLLVLSNIVYIT